MTLHDADTGLRTEEATAPEPLRPPTPGGVSMRPAMIVLGLGRARSSWSSSPSGSLSSQSPGRRSRPRAAPCAVSGDPAAGRAGRRPALADHRGRASRRRTSSTPSPSRWARCGSRTRTTAGGAGQYDAQMRFRSDDSQGALLAFFAADMKPQGWQIFDRGPAANDPGALEVLGKLAGSDGYYWEMGATVSPTTFGRGAPAHGQTDFTIRLFQEEDPRLIRAAAGGFSAWRARPSPRPAAATSSDMQVEPARLAGAKQVGPHEEVDRVEQVAHAGVRGQQDQRRHHHARDRADLGRGARGAAVQVAGQEHRQHEADRERQGPAAATGTRVTSTWPGSALAAVDGMALRPSGKSTTSSMRANGPRSAKGKIAGTATTSMPANMASGRRCAVAVARREQGERGQRPGGELHGRRDAEHDAGRERPTALRQDHGEEEERHDRDVVAPRRQRAARPGGG